MGFSIFAKLHAGFNYDFATTFSSFLQSDQYLLVSIGLIVEMNKKFGRYGTAKSMPTTAVSKISETTFNLHRANRSLIEGELVTLYPILEYLRRRLRSFKTNLILISSGL